MDMLVSLQGQKQNLQVSSRKILSNGSDKNLWLVAREGSLTDIDLSLALLKKNGGSINSRNAFGLTPLHIATRRNHIPIVRRLLAAGADPDARDGESGFSSLHRALHFGHLAVASILLQSGASVILEDSKCRTPIDLLSRPVSQVVGKGNNSVVTEVHSWGSGANYQLGTGNAHIQKLPCKVESLHGSFIKLVFAAKFHSVAVTARGELYTWGFGRGGRLGHPDFDIHSGQAAVIIPRQVTLGLGSRRVKAISAAKHHTVIATEGGEVFTWGSNREGQLGYTSVDTQPTPRRVSSLRSRIVAVAAANKHTAVVSEIGEVFTWGCNKEGQLGYGTSNSASNYTPRVVEYLKGKVFIAVTAAKYHTVVLGTDGEVYTWGHRLVTPKRVIIARNLKKSGSTILKFHRTERLHVVAVAAGMVHSVALTDDGALFYWVSSDPDLRCQQLYCLSEQNMVHVSAGKYWTAAVTATGNIYMWDGKKGKDKPPVATRLHGVKRASSVSVGETHILYINSFYHPVYSSNVAENHLKQTSNVRDEVDELNEDLMFDDSESNNIIPSIQDDISGHRVVPSLKSLCEKVAAENLVEPRNAIHLLEIADSLGTDDLRKYCEEIVIGNLDYILAVSSQAIANASLDILVKLEKSLYLRSSEPWSYHCLSSPTASFPAVVYSEEEDSENEAQRTRNNPTKKSTLRNEVNHGLEFFLEPKDDQNLGICKKVRTLRKKLQQIEMLEAKQSSGHLLDDQQIAKLKMRSFLESSLTKLGDPAETQQGKKSSLVLPDGKGNRKSELSRKQRRNNKQRGAQDAVPDIAGVEIEANHVKDFSDVAQSQVSQNKEGANAMMETTLTNQLLKDLASASCPHDRSNLVKSKNSLSAFKKKSRKGGLSMFLSGALDNSTKDVAPPSPPLTPTPTPKIEGPAWGGAKFSRGFASLREIQNEQSKVKGSQPTTTRTHDQIENAVDGRGDGKILLSSFLPSKPIPMVSPCASQASDGERSTPPWTASGTPPLNSRPSLRNIQMLQGKHHHNHSHSSPKTRVAGFSVTSTGQGCPSDSTGMNRWFKPEVDMPSSIRSIQIEEKAIKDLKRFYSSVKIVKNQS